MTVIDRADKLPSTSRTGPKNRRSLHFVRQLCFDQPRPEIDGRSGTEWWNRSGPAIDVACFQLIVARLAPLLFGYGDVTDKAGEDANQASRLQAIDPAHHLFDFVRRVLGMRNHWNLAPSSSRTL